MTNPELVVVPKNLYYHEIAYVRGLERAIEEIKKLRDGYADQAKFADIDQAVCFREFVRRVTAVLEAKS